MKRDKVITSLILVTMPLVPGDKLRRYQPTSENGGGSAIKTREGFKQFLDRFDTDNDGYISSKELRAALRELGMGFSTYKSWRAMKTLGRRDEENLKVEKELLIDYAQKNWGIRIDI